MEVHHLPGVPHPVAPRVGRVGRLPQRPQCRTVGLLQFRETGRTALLHRPHPVRVPDGHKEIVTHLVAQEPEVVRPLDLVADDFERDAEVTGVVQVLAVHRDALAGGLGHQERHVEAGEHAGGERVGARRHVDHDVLVRAVDEVVEAQLHRSDLGVVAGDAEVRLGERAGRHQPDLPVVEPHRPGTGVVDRVVLTDTQQPRALSGRCRLDHLLGGGDPRIGAAQVLLDERQVCAHRGQPPGLLLVEPERGAQVLVDVGVHRDDMGLLGGEVTDEERGQRRLAATALSHESDLHVHLR